MSSGNLLTANTGRPMTHRLPGMGAPLHGAAAGSARPVATPARAASGGANGATAGDALALFSPYKLGEHTLKHRIVMAPMTRDRAVGTVPQPSMAMYYAQRATDGGLLISEGTIVSETGHGYPDVPGLYTQEQVEAWKPITSAVKDKGAVFFAQIWHCGRASIAEYQPGGHILPVSSSTLPITQNLCFSAKQMAFVPYGRPRALDVKEIPGIVDEYRLAAWNAIQAGFDGVELHSANGYLMDQFLKSEINKRTDEYGGPIENRVRFVLEVVDACCDQIGSGKVGIRLSPFGGFLNATDSNPYALIAFLLEELNKRNLAYVHMVEPVIGGNADIDPGSDSLAPFRSICSTTFIAAGGYNKDSAESALATGHADLIAFGRPFISNPDLVERLRLGAELQAGNPALYYAPGDKGYIDYPTLEEANEIAKA